MNMMTPSVLSRADLLSILTHGLAATPVMHWIDRRYGTGPERARLDADAQFVGHRIEGDDREGTEPRVGWLGAEVLRCLGAGVRGKADCEHQGQE